MQVVESDEQRSRGDQEKEEAGESSATASQQRWETAFLTEVAELLSELQDDSGWSRLNFVLTDLRTVLRYDSTQFMKLLFCGYLYAGDAICRRHGSSIDNVYVKAAKILADQFGESLPEGLFELTEEKRSDTPA